MAIHYKIVKQAEPGIMGGGNYKYYARACGTRKINLREISDMLAQRSALSPGDVFGTVIGLVDLIPGLLMDGHTVEVGELGTFSLSLKSKGENSKDEVSYRSIKNLKINFRAGSRLKDVLAYAKFRKYRPTAMSSGNQ
jgi:predicted histone-like DNA-binding protein